MEHNGKDHWYIDRTNGLLLCINLLFLFPDCKGISVHIFQHTSALGFF